MTLLLAFLGGWETTLLVGAGAASIPIVIHLLNRRRFRVVTWAAMRFLLAAQRQNTRKIRLEQLLLLAVRTFLVLLILLAMASVTPWAERLWASVWPDSLVKRPVGLGRTHHVFVLDGSMSMSTSQNGATLFDRARLLAIQKIKEAPAGDAFSVLLLKDFPTWIVGEAAVDSRKVAKELESIVPSHGNASLSAGLNMVAGKLQESAGKFPNRAVYFVTDMQRSTWKLPVSDKGDEKEKETGVLQEIGKKARTIFVDVGREGVGNRAVTDLGIDLPFVTTGLDVPIFATLQNFSLEPKANLRVELWIGKAKEAAGDPSLPLQFVTQKLVAMDAGEKGALVFLHKFVHPGTYAVQVRIEGDELPIDDERSVIVTVKETVPVLMVNGKTAQDRYEQATEYARLALNPFPKGAEPKFAPLRPKVITAGQFAEIPDADLVGYDALFLADVGSIGPNEMRRLEMFLRLGGGVIFAAGDQVADHLEAYDRVLFKKEQGLLPAKLIKRVQAPADHYFSLHVPAEELFQLPPLRAFAGADDRISLRNTRFRQYLQAQPANDPKVRTLLTFMPEVDPDNKTGLDKSLSTQDPALIEWNPPLPRGDGPPRKGPIGPVRYRGKVVLLTSSLNMDWNSWPGSPSYGAMMQEIIRLAVSGKLRDNALTVGSVLEEVFPTGGLELDVSLSMPDPRERRGEGAERGKPAVKKLRTQAQGDVSVFRWTDTDISGLYVLSSKNDPREAPFAVNFPSSNADQSGGESDLVRATRQEFQESYPSWEIQFVVDPRQAQTGNAVGGDVEFELPRFGPEIAHKLLLLALFLQILEIVLAWRFGHYTAVTGVTAEPARGRVFPTTIALASSFVFALIAFILIDAARTGDFLAFLPDGLRLAIERSLGIPPADAGEGSRWLLEWSAFFKDQASDPWLAGALVAGVIVLLFWTLRREAPQTVGPRYKLLLGGLRLFLILYTLAVLLPQQQLRIDRQGWPDIVLLIDDSRSMGEPDSYEDEHIRERAQKLGQQIKEGVIAQLPEKMKRLEAELAQRREGVKDDDVEAKKEIAFLQSRLLTWQNQLASANSPQWRPTRLQLAQALLAQPNLDWLRYLVFERQTKLHIYHLDPAGRAFKLTDDKGPAGEITEAEPALIDRARLAMGALEAEGRDSRLGTALRQVIDQYRGASLASVIMLTDGVTTRDETVAQAAEYAAQKGVPLFFVGIGDDHEIRDLKLHDLQVPDTVFVHDVVNFEARLTGHGFKDLEVPVVLKLKDAQGKEKEVGRTKVRIQAHGKSERVRLRYQANEIGRKQFIVEVEVPKSERPDKIIPPGQLRLERTIEVIDAKMIKVLYIESTPRYEFRFLKALLERESLDAKKNKSVDLKVLLLDADPDFASTDKTALNSFPATREDLEQYDVILIGDCDPRHPKLGEARLRMIADLVRGEDSKGRKTNKTGAGLLMIAGPNFAPHAYKNTPLGEVLPVEPSDKRPPENEDKVERLKLDLTPVGQLHQIFRLSSDENENRAIWQRLQPMYWYATGYRIKPLAEVLAVHPTARSQFSEPGQDPRHPLAVTQFVGSGRTMFFGFDETWRWRFREDEVRFNEFWIQTIRYLSRTRVTRTELRVDRQTPYRLGETIKVTVRFPDNLPIKDEKTPKLDVKVIAEYRSHQAEAANPEIQNLTLEKIEGSWGTYEYKLDRTREGKYRFWLASPDVSKQQPDGQKPAAEAIVELPPGELDRLRMDQLELTQAADVTQGRFYNLANADDLLEDLPTGFRVSVSTPRPPWLLWNHPVSFFLVLGLLAAEWILRKRKHLL